jgi:Ca2+-transporting ATPase
MGGFALCMYATASCGANASGARTMAFTLLALAPLVHAWSCRSPTMSVAQIRPALSSPLLVACAISAGIHLVAVLIPTLRPVFRVDELHARDWWMIAVCAVAVLPAVELAKSLDRLRRHAVAPLRVRRARRWSRRRIADRHYFPWSSLARSV